MKTLPDEIFHGTFLELRNAARQLGGQANWQKRKVLAAFGQEVLDRALTLSDEVLKETKNILVACFESQFTDLDKAKDLAIKKSQERLINDLPYEDEEDI